MKRLRAFTYFEPATLAEAIDRLVTLGPGARVLAGGTDLVVDMKTARLRPTAVVNLKTIPGLAGIDAVAAGTRIGALTRVSDLERSEIVQRRHPALASAAAVLATPPVRRLATIGGNICRASPAADLAPALIVHEAVATIAGPDGVREEAVEGLFVGPGRTRLGPGDIITSLYLPAPTAGSGGAHLKIGRRGGGTDLAIVAASAALSLTDGIVNRVRIALASVAPVPVRAHRAERALEGRHATGAAAAASAREAVADSSPIDDVRATADHRRALAEVVTRRVVEAARRSAAEPAGEGER